MVVTHLRNRNPPNSTRQNLVKLPCDMLYEILGHTEILHNSDLLNFTRTCKALHSTIPTDILYRHIRFRVSGNEEKVTTSRMTKFLRVLRRYPERGSWVREAEFTWTHATISRWSPTLQELLSRLPSLHTLEVRTNRQFTQFEIRQLQDDGTASLMRKARHFASFLRCLSQLATLRNLTIEDPTLTAKQASQFSSLSQVRQLRVSWCYCGNSQELGFLASKHNRKGDEPSALTKLDLLTALSPVGLPVDYVRK